jgi:hypothetical protein
MTAILAFLLVLVFIVVAAVVTALPVMWLLNTLISPTLLTAVFGTAHVGFLQAYGILLLCGLLFRGSSISTTTKS